MWDGRVELLALCFSFSGLLEFLSGYALLFWRLGNDQGVAYGAMSVQI